MATPIKFSFHTWLNHNLLSTRLHTPIERQRESVAHSFIWSERNFFVQYSIAMLTFTSRIPINGFAFFRSLSMSLSPFLFLWPPLSFFFMIHDTLSHARIFFFFRSIILYRCVSLVFFRTQTKGDFLLKFFTNPLIYCRVVRSQHIHSDAYSHIEEGMKINLQTHTHTHSHLHTNEWTNIILIFTDHNF